MLHNENAKKEIQLRIKIVLSLVLLLIGILVYNLYFLQVDCHHKYAMLSEKNRIKLSPLLPKRGRIFTADGKQIASNKYKYKLTLESCAENIFLENLSLLETYIDLGKNEKEELLNIRKKVSRYTPIVVKNGLSWDEYARLSLIFYRLNYVSIDYVYMREYSLPQEFSHVIGYAAKSDDNLQILTGKTGVELSKNEELIGKIGNVKTEINAVGRKMRILNEVTPINGNDIFLTLNADVQKYAFDLIAEEKAGACVVLDIRDGGVIALVSVPGFDTNLIASKINREQWNSMINDPLLPLMNRAIVGTYPPGSLFKIVVAFAALSEGVITASDTFFCSGEILQDNAIFHCWNRHGHGRVNVSDALCMSCDCFFFEVSKKLGIDKIVEYAEKFGFGKKTGLELPNENAGLLPNKKWKLLRYGSTWKPYETLITSIGQGALLATLLQTAVMLGKLYSGDYNFAPTLMKNTDESEEKTRDPLNPKHAMIIRDALYQVCNSWNGTAARSCRADYGIAGKTGSSQVRKIKLGEAGVGQQNFPWHLRDHAFFAGVAPHKNPRYVVAVFIEHGGGGAKVAAPIARKIFDKLMEIDFNGN
ncbi:MAG: penicillin-binding protein 2 [Holosporaceae bacterium]|jgi:penicillin-binding protein 2|nr:penicillin-binding protein 2 [Holosporaceae bacterium]